MNVDAFCSLCVKMETKYGLQSSKRTSVQEKVAIFSYVVGQIASNKHTCECFLHLGKMISRYFNEILVAMQGLTRDMIKPNGPDFSSIPPEILNDDRYMPHYKVIC